MPRGDGSGPQGKGSMTGRGMGRCSGNSSFATSKVRNKQGGVFSFLEGLFQGGGRGQGGGRRGGMGRGMGQGMGRGTGMRQDVGRDFYRPEEYETDKARPFNRNAASEEAAQLKERARQMEEELDVIRRKIDNMESGKSVSQVLVDEQRCTACGICEDICPKGAISVREVAEVDQGLCTLCGTCINKCPQGALRII